MIDVGAYALTATVAIVAGWRPADLVWGVWIIGLVGTLFTIGIPWLVLTAWPGLDPSNPPEKRTHDLAEWRQSLFFLAVFWGSIVMGYGIAGLFLFDLVPLPAEVSTREWILVLPRTVVVCVSTYWAMIVVNGGADLWHAWRAIRRGARSPTDPFVSLGRVLVAGTVMGFLYLFRVDSVAVALLLFLYYIPDEVFAARVLGMR